MENQIIKQEASKGLKENTLKRFEALKAESLALSSQCKSIKINDEGTLSIAQQILSKSNQLLKIIDNKRAEIKKPYLDAGKTIDSIAKEIITPLEEGLVFGKEELRKWNEEQKRIQKEKELENEKIVSRINKIREQLQEKISECNTPEKCQNLIESINKVFPSIETFKQYAQDAKVVKDNFIMLLSIRKQTFEAAIKGNVNLVAKNVEETKTIEIANTESVNAIKEKKEIISENNIALKSNIRKVWKFEIVDENNIAKEFTSPDDKKIREYMNTHKEFIEELDNKTIGGVRFYIDEVPTIK